MPFKTPDGKEFSTRAEWRDYMMSTYYTYKDKIDEPSPLLKVPGDIDGQAFEISDCKNTTMAIMDHSEQVQIDNVTGCKIFIGACASSTFIRNCDNCIFYICCRQLRLREVTNSTLYVLSMAEVHIEYSNGLKFAPFNGSYPLHGEHLKAANIDPLHNLWYDVYDHNDSDKSHSNWKLLPESEYEQPWFPAGVACEFAAPRVKIGSVAKVIETENMQSFGIEQMKVDAQNVSISPSLPPPIPTPVSAASDDESAVRSVIQLFASANDVAVELFHSHN